MKDDLIKQYNAACTAVNTAVAAMRDAPDGADLAPLETSFRDAVAAAEAAKTNLERTEELDGIEKRFIARPTPTTPAADLGMDAREVRSYSFLRAVNAAVAAKEGNPRAWEGAELEREASDEVAKRTGRPSQGFYIPLDVQRDQRDMNVTTDGAGGYVVATDLLATSFIDLMRNRMAVKQAGATILSGLVGDVAIPRQTAGGTFYWVAESGAPTESQQTVDQVALTPKTGGAFTDISRKLLLQASIDVENFVRGDLATVCALGLDLAALHGTGTNNQPTGVAATTGIGSVVGGTNGAAPTYGNIIALETEVAQDNADVGSLAYMTNAKVRGKLKSTLITATYGDEMIWDRKTADTPLNGYACHITNQVSSTLTKGNQSASSAIFFANWRDLIIAQWGTLDVLVDPYTGSTSGTVRIVVLQDVDVNVRHAESFAAMLDALTA